MEQKNAVLVAFSSYELKKFISANFWVAGTTVLKALTQLIALKLIALHLGVEGIGVFGQAASCVVALNSLFSSGLLNFTVSEISKNEVHPDEQKKIFSVIGFWILFAQVFFLCVAALFAENLSQYVFGTDAYKWFFYTLAGLSIFFNLHSVSTGLLSASGKIKDIFKAHFAAFFTTTILLLIVVKSYNIGVPFVAAFLVLVSQSIWLLFFLIKTGQTKITFFKPAIERLYIFKILKFSMIMIVTGLLSMVFQIYMRNEILKIPSHGWSDVGSWQAILKVSEITMSFLGLSIMTSYFPQISRISSVSEIKVFISRFAVKFGLLIFSAISVLMLLAELVLRVIYDKSFADLSSLLRLQLLGDVFKLSSWLFTYFFLAKLPLFLFLFYEVVTLASLTVLSIALKEPYGVNGLIYAHVINSVLFFVIGFIFLQITLKNSEKWFRK